MESKKWIEFYRKADRKTRLEHLEKLLEIAKFQEKRTAETLELVNLIVRVNQEICKTDDKQEAGF